MSNTKKLKRESVICASTMNGVFGGAADGQCELTAGHRPPHERKTPPLTGQWEDLPGGQVNIISMSMHGAEPDAL